MNWASKYVGLEFQDGGRGPEFVDCWGLVCVVYRNELQIELPSYAEISTRDLINVSRAMKHDDTPEIWQAVDRTDLREFDLVAMTQYGGRSIAHVGIMTPGGKVLHSEAGCNTVSVPLDHISIRERLKCFRRHKKASLLYGVNPSL